MRKRRLNSEDLPPELRGEQPRLPVQEVPLELPHEIEPPRPPSETERPDNAGSPYMRRN